MPKFNQETIFNVVVALVVFALLMWAYNKFVATPAKPAGALTQAEYDAITDVAVKALYHKDAASGYWVK